MARRALRIVGSSEPPRAALSPKRQGKLDAILGVASEMFNASGVSSVSLGEVAARTGMSRATLYYYVADREDLLFKCYLRSCEAEAELLAEADELSGGLPGLLHYVRISIRPRTARTVIADVGSLSEGARKIIVAAQRRMHVQLREMISQGVKARAIRPCDEDIIARTIAGIVSWSPLADRWYDAGEPQALALDPDAVCDFLCEGATSDPDEKLSYPLDISAFSRLQVAGFDRKSRADMRIEQIATVASRLFNQRGVEGVSLEDVASELGATRGVVYHYFQDKEDLLRVCQARAVELYEAFFDAAEAAGRDGAERAAFVTHLNAQAQAGSLAPLAPWIGLVALSPAQRQRQRRRIRSLFDRTIALAEQGLADGSRRPHDVRSIARLRAGSYLWIPSWLSEQEGYTPRRIADEITDLFQRGLRAR
jgi:AcrR family transcriptional regulator